MLPFAAFAFVSINYFLYYLQDRYIADKYADSEENKIEILKSILAAVIFIPLWVHKVYGEYKEISVMKFEFFTRFWNWNDILMLSSSAFVMFACLAPGNLVEMATLRPIAAVSSCFLIAKCFDWLRLFEHTSFYI